MMQLMQLMSQVVIFLLFQLLIAHWKKLQPAVVFLPLREQDQKILPVFGPGL